MPLPRRGVTYLVDPATNLVYSDPPNAQQWPELVGRRGPDGFSMQPLDTSATITLFRSLDAHLKAQKVSGTGQATTGGGRPGQARPRSPSRAGLGHGRGMELAWAQGWLAAALEPTNRLCMHYQAPPPPPHTQPWRQPNPSRHDTTQTRAMRPPPPPPAPPPLS